MHIYLHCLHIYTFIYIYIDIDICIDKIYICMFLFCVTMYALQD